MTNKTAYFDVETGSLPDTYLDIIKPQFKAPSNYKKEDAIAESVKAQEQEWRAKAALDATTAKVLAIGLLDGNMFDLIEGDERVILERFWMWADTMQLSLGHTIAGFCIFHFDLPLLVRRSWINKVPVPGIVRRYSYKPWNEGFVDIAELWQCGNRDQRISLDTLAKVLGVGAKTGSGADFAKLWVEDKSAAVAYLRNDIELAKACYERLTGTETKSPLFDALGKALDPLS